MSITNYSLPHEGGNYVCLIFSSDEGDMFNVSSVAFLSFFYSVQLFELCKYYHYNLLTTIDFLYITLTDTSFMYYCNGLSAT